MKRFFQIFVPAGILIAAAFGFFFFSSSRPVVKVRIEKGSSVRKIASNLKSSGAIPSEIIFLLMAKFSGQSKNFKHGVYLFPNGNYAAILRQLQQGGNAKIKITLPEGWNAFQIAQKLQGEGVIANAETFLEQVAAQKLEGKLFPETYFFETEMREEVVLQILCAEFEKQFSLELQEKSKARRMTPAQVLTLASIVEREAQDVQEKPRIASVYLNRFKMRKGLEADPTVQYALSQGREWKKNLTYQDLKTESPYNTYRYAGLPPGPICNPGLGSILAVLNPEETKFLYFFADGSGKHIFSTTYDEHLRLQSVLRAQKKRVKG